MSPNSSSSSSADHPAPTDAQPAQRTRSWLRAPRFVVPRELSIYYRVSCQGIPFHQVSSFARLQARALSPFAHFGANAVRQGAHIHLWIWDKALEERFARDRGGITRFSTVAQSLLSKPAREGVIWLASGQGVEAQLWSRSQLQDAQWFDEPPSASVWKLRHAEAPALLARGWPLHLPPQLSMPTVAARPWARNLTPRIQPASTFTVQQLSRYMFALAVLSVLGWGAWLLGQKHGLENYRDHNQTQQQQRLSQRSPDQASRTTTLQLQQRIQSIQGLASGTSPRRVLEGLSTILTRQGLWLRDINIQAGTVEATIVAPAGVTPRLTSIVGALEGEPLFHDARFVDVSPGGGFKFSWRTHPSPISGQTPP